MIRHAAISLLLFVACTRPTVQPAGRPCSATEPCGPGTRCDPKLAICLPDHIDLAVADARPGSDTGRPEAAVDRGNVDTLDTLDSAADGWPVDAAPLDAPLPDTPPPADQDNDKVPDVLDNCPVTPNPTQADMDSDGDGDACDSDIDGDTLPNTVDPFPTTANVVYYYKTADKLLTDGNVSGTWTKNGTALCQNSYSDAFAVSLKAPFLPGSNYLVETRITVLDTNPSITDSPGVGIDFRMTSTNGYDCVIDLWDFYLLIGEWDSAGWQVRTTTAPQSVPTAGPYLLRASANGNNLSCQLPGTTVAQISDSSNPAGIVGFFTYYTKACIDYLLVIQAP